MASTLTSPVDTTLAVLAASGTVRAHEALISALSIPREEVQCAATRVIVTRTGLNSHLDLLARFDQLPMSAKEVIRAAGNELEIALRQMLLHADGAGRQRALQIVDETWQFSLIPHLFTLLKQPGLSELPLIHDILGRLFDRLYDACQSVEPSASGIPTAEALRQLVLSQLNSAISDYDKLALSENVVLGVLILGEPHHPTVKHALWHGPQACRDRAAQFLLQSRHPGVLRQIAASLSVAYPHPKIFEVIHERRDPELIAALLRGCDRRLTPHQQQNLRQIETLPWLDISTEMLATIPQALHPALVTFVAATRLPKAIKAAVHEWLLRHGTPSGRDAAEAHLPMIEENVVQEVVRQSLHDDDSRVQAWAVHQLRQHGMPEAFALLLERLDNPNVEVQNAAREELSSFNTERVLQLSEELSAEESLVAGHLVQKVDPEVQAKLRRLLAQPIRQKRIRIARAVIRLGLQHLVPEAFTAMADDLDPLVRRTAVAALGSIREQNSYVALRHLMNDPHPRVREEAESALQQWMATNTASLGE